MIRYFITFIPLSLLHYLSFSSTFLHLSPTLSNTNYKVQQQQGVWWPCWWRSFGKSSGDAASDLHDRGCKWHSNLHADVCLAADICHHPAKIFRLSQKRREKKYSKEKAWCKCVKKCALNITHKVTTQTILKKSLFSSSLKLWKARPTSFSCRDVNRPLDTQKYHCVA